MAEKEGRKKKTQELNSKRNIGNGYEEEDIRSYCDVFIDGKSF